jgi:hypothetical protein
LPAVYSTVGAGAHEALRPIVLDATNTFGMLEAQSFHAGAALEPPLKKVLDISRRLDT